MSECCAGPSLGPQDGTGSWRSSLAAYERPKRRKSFKNSLKCDFFGTFHQEISRLRKPGISLSSLIYSTSFLNINEKISFLYNPLLLKLKSLKAAVYLLHCTRAIEGSQVSFQPGEQQKLVLYKWQAATNCLPFTPSLWMGLCSIWRAEHNPCSLLPSHYQEICSFYNSEEMEYISCCTAHVLIKTKLPVTVFSWEVKYHLESMLNEFFWIPSPIVYGKRHLNKIWGFPVGLGEVVDEKKITTNLQRTQDFKEHNLVLQ